MKQQRPEQTMTEETQTSSVDIKWKLSLQLIKFVVRPGTITLGANETFKVQAPEYSALLLLFFQGRHIGNLRGSLDEHLLTKHAPFGISQKRIPAGEEEPIGKPEKGWPAGEYPYLVYVEKYDRLAHGASPPEIILL